MLVRPEFRVGVIFPQLEIEADAVAIKDFAQAIEALGFSHLVAYDHVVGADIRHRPDWQGPYTHESAFHEPMILFAYLAGLTQRLFFSTGVIVLPQRQTVLFGKQAANLDIVSGGRLRLAVGIGWNQIEYEALGMSFEHRGAMLDDQVRVLRRLWTEPVLTEHGPFHDISEAGINPLPLQRPIPLWIGGVSAAAIRRAAQTGDGWLPSFPAHQAARQVDQFREALLQAGRAPDSANLENIIFLGTTLGGPLRDIEDAVEDVMAWHDAGAGGVAIHTMGMGLKGSAEHVRLLRRIAEELL